MQCFIRVALIFLLPFSQLPSIAIAAEAQSKDDNWVSSIIAAHEESLRLYRGKKDVREAIRILEKHGVGRILLEKPEQMGETIYATVLNDYGFYLSETEDRYPEAEHILKKVIEVSPDREVTYLNLGDVYFKMSKKRTQDNFKYKDLTRINYTKYVEILEKKKKRTLLPERVVKVVYDAEGLDLCKFAARLLSNKQEKHIDLFLSPEKKMGEFLKTKVFPNDKTFEDLKGYGIVVSQDDSWLLDDDRHIWRVSKIDVDNDGKEEVRFETSGGSLHCECNHFLKQDKNGIYGLVRNEAVNAYCGEGQMCGGDTLEFLRYAGRNYIVYNSLPHRMGLFFIKGSEKIHVCDIDISYEKPELSASCTGEICKVVTRKADSYIKLIEEHRHDWERGFISGAAEKEVTGRVLLESQVIGLSKEQLVKFVIENQVSGLNTKYAGRFLIDMDNDGIDELLIKEKSGKHFYLGFEILKKYGQIYKTVDPYELWKGFGQIYESNKVANAWDDDFVFEKTGGNNYLVKLSREHNDPGKSYDIDIFCIRNNFVEKIGTIKAIYKRTASIKKLAGR